MIIRWVETYFLGDNLPSVNSVNAGIGGLFLHYNSSSQWRLGFCACLLDFHMVKSIRVILFHFIHIWCLHKFEIKRAGGFGFFDNIFENDFQKIVFENIHDLGPSPIYDLLGKHPPK